MNCKFIQYNVSKPFEKNVTIYYQRLLMYVIFVQRLLLFFGSLAHLWLDLC